MKTFKQIMRELGLSIGKVAAELRDHAAGLAMDFDPADIADDEWYVGGDVRLQIVDRSWSLHTGDAQYDQDHRGAWGAGWITAGASLRECRKVARELIDEAIGQYCEQEEESAKPEPNEDSITTEDAIVEEFTGDNDKDPERFDGLS